jgi:predicted phage tail protein
VVNAKHADAATLEPNADSLKSSLASVQEKLVATKSALLNASSNLDKAQDELHATKDKCADLYSTLCVERRKLQRTTARKGLLEQQIKLLKSVELPSCRGDAACAIQLLNETKSENMHLGSKLSQLMEKCALEASHSKQKQSVLKEQLAVVKKKN